MSVVITDREHTLSCEVRAVMLWKKDLNGDGQQHFKILIEVFAGLEIGVLRLGMHNLVQLLPYISMSIV